MEFHILGVKALSSSEKTLNFRDQSSLNRTNNFLLSSSWKCRLSFRSNKPLNELPFDCQRGGKRFSPPILKAFGSFLSDKGTITFGHSFTDLSLLSLLKVSSSYREPSVFLSFSILSFYFSSLNSTENFLKRGTLHLL